MEASHLMATYQPQDVSFVSGQGAWLTDTAGKRYLDLMAGIAVCALGHAHPEVTETIREQAGRLLHTSNVFRIDAQIELADKLTAVSGMDSLFCGNSGAEANEAAIKIARLLGNSREIDTPSIIVMDGAFHGRTMATLSASGSRKVQAGFEPLVSGFVRAPFGDVDALRMIAKNNPRIVAILVEPIQGECGVNVPPDDYLKNIRELCDESGWLMMLDEVQTGNGRTGSYFAYQQDEILPDVVTSAKGLANGIPIGACLARGEAASVFQVGHHGSTFGGNPLAARVGCTVIDVIQRDRLCQKARELGEKIVQRLTEKLAGHPEVVAIRGKGLMIGIELREPCRHLLRAAMDRGILITVTSEKVIRLLPPLIIGEEEALTGIDELCRVIEEQAHAEKH